MFDMVADRPLKIAHCVGLHLLGGVERAYCEFINFKSHIFSVEHHTILVKNHIVPFLREQVSRGSSSIHAFLPDRLFNKAKIPKIVPGYRSVRKWHRKRLLAKIQPDVLVLWSRPELITLGKRVPALKIIYYEHGASWFFTSDVRMRRLRDRVSGVICNSFAAKRMLELKWGDWGDGRIKVCLNAVRPDCLPPVPKMKLLPQGRPFRLGLAGRVESLKGMPLALHALAELKKRGISCELAVAGEGKELQKLRTLSRNLTLGNQVSFLGVVQNMSTFYEAIDCFLCPSLREPFGLVCAEAMAHGCPVIAATVDGLPEVVLHGETGFCLEATLPLEDYPAFGGAMDDVPGLIYNPVSDRLEPPKLLDPRLIADAVAELVHHASQYETMSQAASLRARERFDHQRHAQDVLEAMIAFCKR